MRRANVALMRGVRTYVCVRSGNRLMLCAELSYTTVTVVVSCLQSDSIFTMSVCFETEI